MGSNNLKTIMKNYQKQKHYEGRRITIGEIKEQLAKHLNISFHSVHSIYQNVYLPRAVECLKICEFFSITIQELINEK